MGILKIDGVNLFVENTNINDVNLLISKNIHIVRIPFRWNLRNKIVNYTNIFLQHNCKVLIVFDLSCDNFKKSIDFMLNKYHNQIYYEIFNEPWAMNGNDGYCKFDSTERTFLEQTKWIDYVHSKCHNCKTLNAGVANFSEDNEHDLLMKYVYRGHQDILSIHIYGCNIARIKTNKFPILNDWHKPIWITEIGTINNKSEYIGNCVTQIFNLINPQEIIWFDYNSNNFGIKNDPIFNKLFW